MNFTTWQPLAAHTHTHVHLNEVIVIDVLAQKTLMKNTANRKQIAMICAFFQRLLFWLHNNLVMMPTVNESIAIMTATKTVFYDYVERWIKLNFEPLLVVGRTR